MCRANGAVRCRDGRGDDSRDVQQVQCSAGADDVDDGIDAAHFVEFDVVEGDAVHLGLGLAEGAKDAQRIRLHRVGDVGVGDDRDDVAIGAVRRVVVSVFVIVVMMFDDDCVGGGNSAAVDAIGGESPAVEVKTRHDVGDCHCVGTCVDESTHQHVAGDTRPAVHPRSVHVRWFKMRAMAQPAPKPLSMPTTVTPAAHEACMASSAVTPSSDAP